MLLIIVYAFEMLIKIDILTQAVVTVTVIFVFGFVHEAMHYWRAVKLGYKPVWWRTKVRMGFNITSHSNKKEYLKDKRKIALAPYYLLLPISILFLPLGYFLNSIGLIVGGICALIMHCFSLTKEGADVKV